MNCNIYIDVFISNNDDDRNNNNRCSSSTGRRSNSNSTVVQRRRIYKHGEYIYMNECKRTLCDR